MNAKRLRKEVSRCLLVLVCALFAIVLVALCIRDVLIENAIRHVGSALLGTQVQCDRFFSRLFSGRIEINGLVVANPAGYEEQNAFKLDRLVLDVDMSTLFSDKIVVEEILISGLGIAYEQRLNSNNLGEILDNIRMGEKMAAEDTAVKEEEKPAAEKSEPGKSVAITLFDISDTTLAFANTETGFHAVVPLGGITLRGIGEDRNISVEQTVDYLYEQIFMKVASGVRQIGGQVLLSAGKTAGDLADSANEVVNKTLDSAGGALNESVDSVGTTLNQTLDSATDTAAKTLDGAGKSVQDTIKGLKLW